MASVIARSQKLSELFGSSWSFGQMSTVMRCKMGMVHEFELGMINILDLKHKVTSQASKVWRPPTSFRWIWCNSHNPIYMSQLKLDRLAWSVGRTGGSEVDQVQAAPTEGEHPSCPRSSLGNGR